MKTLPKMLYFHVHHVRSPYLGRNTHGICRDIANNRNIVAGIFFLLLHCCEILSFLLETIVSLLLPYSDDLI